MIIILWVLVWSPIATWPIRPTTDFIEYPNQSIGDWFLPILPGIAFWGAMIGVALFIMKELWRGA